MKKQETNRDSIEEVKMDSEERRLMERQSIWCNCDFETPDHNPSFATCNRHGPNQECPEEYYEKLEKKEAEEYKKATETHEKRMEYLRTEGLKYLEETEWMYKPIENYLK